MIGGALDHDRGGAGGVRWKIDRQIMIDRRRWKNILQGSVVPGGECCTTLWLFYIINVVDGKGGFFQRGRRERE